MTSSRTRNRREDHHRRTQLIEAAARVIARDGINAATTRRIAREAEVPVGLVHYWFAGKDELLEAVSSEALNPILDAVTEAAARAAGADSSPLSRLRAGFDVVRKDDVGHQIALYELTFWALRRPALRDLARRQYALYREAGVQATEVWLHEVGAPSTVAPDTLGQLVAALFDGLVISWLADPVGTDVDGALALLSSLIEQHVERLSRPAALHDLAEEGPAMSERNEGAR